MGQADSRRKHLWADEWIGGIASMPAYVTGEGEPYRPEMLLWLEATGDPLVLGSLLGKPGEILGKACESLRETVRNPMVGPPRTPARVRVATPELAEALRAGHPSVEIVRGPTPEIDGVLESLVEAMADQMGSEQSFLVSGASVEAVASFFRAAAALYRAKPWKVVPPDDILSVSVESHGVHKAVLSVIGQLGESFGFLLFSSMANFEVYLDAAESIHRGDKPTMPPFLVLNFMPRSAMEPSVRTEVASHHWELASPKAYPWAESMDKDTVSRPLTAKELVLVEAIASGLVLLVGEKKAVESAFARGEPCLRSYSIETSAGTVPVTFRVPHEERPAERHSEGDVLDRLYELEEKGTLAESELREPLEEELTRQLLESPEGSAVSSTQAHRFVMGYAADYLGCSIATLDPAGLREVLFDIIPRKVSIEASEAGSIVEDCRAFYRFLARAYALEQAEDCLRVLAPGAEKKLEKALADPRNFGMAKSLFMAGKDAGFDMQSKEGIEAWMRSIQGKPLPPSARLPLDDLGLPRGRNSGQDRERRRKAARKAPKRNR
jgi:hypothetical protein